MFNLKITEEVTPCGKPSVINHLLILFYPFASQSDPDLPPDHGSPSPTDEVFDPAPPPPPYMPPQPSIEEARQQMHSLLDDAFALVSPSSQGSAGVSGVSPALPSPSPQARPSGRQWGSYPAAPSHSPFSAVSASSCSRGNFSCGMTICSLFIFFLLSSLAEVCRTRNVSYICSGSAAEVSFSTFKTSFQSLSLI